MAALSPAQVAAFERDGYVVASGGVSPAGLEALNRELAGWVEESRRHRGNFGRTIDGKSRFDLEASHGPEHPRLRRINNPVEISEVFREAMFNAPYVDMVAQLIGPDVKFHHCKVNVKMPGSTHEVRWHQDHPFDPHTNDDEVVALLLLTDMTEENGALRVVPGSHRERYSLYQDGRYTGEIAAREMAALLPRVVSVTGQAGDVCILHTWTAHGSGPNRSKAPRSLFITDYTAADAVALTPPAVPSSLHGAIVRGQPTRFARLKAGLLELPQPFTADSFFSYQEGRGDAAE